MLMQPVARDTRAVLYIRRLRTCVRVPACSCHAGVDVFFYNPTATKAKNKLKSLRTYVLKIVQICARKHYAAARTWVMNLLPLDSRSSLQYGGK